MKCREKLALEEPEAINPKYLGGCAGCPSDRYTIEVPSYCDGEPETCTKCWDRELPNTKPTTIEHDGCCECKHFDKEEVDEPCCECKGTVIRGTDEYDTRKDFFELDTPDMVNAPPHYLNGIECIDELIAVFGKEVVADFCLCNVWKYRKRALYKNGQEDLDKADWYMKKFMELEGKLPKETDPMVKLP